MNTKGNIGFHMVSKIAAGGPGCRRSWVLSLVLEVKARKSSAGAEDQLGDKNPHEKLEAGLNLDYQCSAGGTQRDTRRSSRLCLSQPRSAKMQDPLQNSKTEVGTRSGVLL